MRHGCILLGLMASVTLAACGQPTQLYVAHNTVIGLDAAVDTNRQSGRLIFGYDRQFITLAPKAVPCEEDGANCREAMAALSCNEVVVEGVFLTRFKDRLATGKAAVEAAEAIKKKPEIATLFDCWRPENNTKEENSRKKKEGDQ